MAKTKTPEEYLEEARKMIGTETEPVKARYPVEYEPIRRYCHMTGNANPLFIDPEYAKKTKYGDVPCPQLMINTVASLGVFPPAKMGGFIQVPAPGKVIINLTTEFEWFKPVKVGDHLSSKSRLADVYIKSVRMDPKCFWTVTQNIISNQDDEVVCIASNIGLTYRTPEEVKAAGDA